MYSLKGNSLPQNGKSSVSDVFLQIQLLIH